MASKIKSAVKEFGYFNAFLYFLSNILGRVSGSIKVVKYYIYKQRVDSTSFPVKRRFGSIDVLEVHENEEKHREAFPRPKAVLDARFKQSSRCFAAYRNEIFEGYIWFVKDDYFEDEIRCHYVLQPKDKVAWDFDVYIEPQARFGVAFSKLWHEVFNVLEDEGVQWTLSRISAFNMNSIRSHERLGARRIYTITAFCLGPMQIIFSDIRPYFSVSTKNFTTLIINIEP